MPLGDLYNYITIEQYTATDSSYGDNDTFVWSTYASCWAERVTDATKEGIMSDKISAKDSLTWKVRYDSGILEKMRIYFDGNYYNISGIVIEGRKKFMLLRSYEIVNT